MTALAKQNTETEFYISADGEQVGVSLPTLARLCGVSETTLSGILAALEDPDTLSQQGTNVHAILIPLVGQNVYLLPDGFTTDRIIHAAAANRLVEYHARRDKNSTAEAKRALKQFARMGFENWVRSITPSVPVVSDRDLIVQCMAEIRSMQSQILDTKGYQKVKDEIPGLRRWMDGIADNRYGQVIPAQKQQNLLPSDAVGLTVREWLQQYTNGRNISKSAKHRLANMASAAYVAMFDREPEMVRRANTKGYRLPPVKSYPPEAFGILENCWKALGE
jgi:hypothetical protein